MGKESKALKASEKKLRDITSVLGEGVYVLDENARLTFLNPEAERLLGWTESELIGKNVHEVMHHRHLDRAEFPAEECPVIKVTREGGTYRTEDDAFTRKDGSTFPVAYVCTAIVEDGRVTGAVTAFQDITERKRKEARLREEKRLSDALNDINAAINSTLTFGEIMQRVVVGSARAIGAETAAIDLCEDGLWVVRYIYGFPRDMIGVGLTDEEAPHAALSAATKRPVAIDDTETDARVDREVMRRFNIRSVLTVPLAVRGDVIGALFFNYHSAPIIFTETQIDFAYKVGASVSLALENARLFQQVESDKRDLEILNEIELNITSDLKLKNLMGIIAENIRALVKTDAAGIVFWDEDARRVSDVFFIGIPAHVVETLKSTPSVTKSIIESRRPGLVEDYPSNPAAVREFADIGLKSAAIVPIISKGKILGAIHALVLFQERRFDERDVRLLEAVARTVAIAIENAYLYEAERNIADILQESLLVMPERIEGVCFGDLYRSATEAARVGGDFYDIFEIEREKVGIIIGDVSGKGIEAAALTSIVKNTIKAHAVESRTPALVMLKTNDLVLKTSPDSTFVTVFFGVLDLATGGLTYCSAGHPPAIIKRKTGMVKLLNKHSPIIGAFDGMHYRSGKEILRKGDTLVVYTDGIIEARQNSDLFSEERLVGFIENLEQTPTKKLPRAIFNKVKDFTKGKLSDDVALLCVSIL